MTDEPLATEIEDDDPIALTGDEDVDAPEELGLPPALEDEEEFAAANEGDDDGLA